MTMETMVGPRGRTYEERDITNDWKKEAGDAVVVVGAGQNTLHMGRPLDDLNQLHPVHVVEVGEPLIPVEPDRLHLVNTPEGQESIAKLIGSGAVRTAYCSLVPSRHMPFLEEYLGYVKDGKVDRLVVAKPVVPTVADMKTVDALVKAIEARRGPEQGPVLYVHEHYIEKGAWHALREQLPKVTERLGRLSSVTVTIQEQRTVEDEGRTAALAGGALEDLGPHVISLGLDIQNEINKTTYTIPDRSRTAMNRFRYGDSELPEGVETGFSINGDTEIIDSDGTAYNLPFAWRGGKGLQNEKEVVLTFTHPETGEDTTVVVDLSSNTLRVPLSINDLFPEKKFDDNGYGAVVERGLNGGDPADSFQSWKDAKVVTKWIQALKNQDPPLYEYPLGASLEELESRLN